MAYFATFLSRIIGTLQTAGLTVVREFSKQAVMGSPTGEGADSIVTVALANANYDAPIPYAGGVAFPMRLTVRFRFYVPCTESTAALETFCDNQLVPALTAAGYEIQSVVLGEPSFCKEVRRLSACALVTIGGLVTRTPLEREATE